MWGNQWEIDQAKAAATSKGRAETIPGGKGKHLGKGKRHWSAAAVHTSYYEPYPFNLDFVVVDSIYFSWDELCDKRRVPEKKVGDCSISGQTPGGKTSGGRGKKGRSSWPIPRTFISALPSAAPAISICPIQGSQLPPSRPLTFLGPQGHPASVLEGPFEFSRP